MISARLFLFIEQVIAAETDIVVQAGHVVLGSTGMPGKIADHLKLTEELEREIVEVFVEGDFESRELRAFLTAETPDTVARLWPAQVRGGSSVKFRRLT